MAKHARVSVEQERDEMNPFTAAPDDAGDTVTAAADEVAVVEDERVTVESGEVSGSAGTDDADSVDDAGSGDDGVDHATLDSSDRDEDSLADSMVDDDYRDDRDYLDVDHEGEEEAEEAEAELDGADDPAEDDAKPLDDWMLRDGLDGGVVKQLDNTVSWSYEGWLNPKTGKPYSKFHYLEHPVVMRFLSHHAGDMTGEQDGYVDIVLTRELANRLSNDFENVYRSYMGMTLTSEKRDFKETFNPKNILKRLRDEWEDNPMKLLGSIIGVIAVIVIIIWMIVV